MLKKEGSAESRKKKMLKRRENCWMVYDRGKSPTKASRGRELKIVQIFENIARQPISHPLGESLIKVATEPESTQGTFGFGSTGRLLLESKVKKGDAKKSDGTFGGSRLSRHQEGQQPPNNC